MTSREYDHEPMQFSRTIVLRYSFPEYERITKGRKREKGETRFVNAKGLIKASVNYHDVTQVNVPGADFGGENGEIGRRDSAKCNWNVKVRRRLTIVINRGDTNKRSQRWDIVGPCDALDTQQISAL